MMKNYFLILSAILFLNTKAQWTNDPLVTVPVSTSFGNQRDLRILSDGESGAFIVWKDYRVGTPDIMIQRLDSLGNPLWTIDGSEVCIQSADQSTPTIISDKKGGVIVAWSDWRSGIERDLYAQRIDANGNLLWATNGAEITVKNEREHSEKIVSDDHGGVIVVWEQQRQTNFTWDIWAQRIDSAGNPVWTVGGLPICIENSNRRNHKVQRDGNGGIYVTWQDERSGDFDIYAQHIDENGNLLWDSAGLAVCVSTGSQTNPKIDPEKQEKGVYISWVDKRNGIDYDVYGNRIDSLGIVRWGATGKPVMVAIGNQSAIDIMSNNKTKGLLVTWKDKRNGKYDIYIQKMDIDGNPLWNPLGVVVCDAPENQKNPNIVSDKHGGAIIIWQDKRSGNYDVYGQRISYKGDPIWNANGEAICTASENQTSPKHIPDNKGGAIVAWEDRRNGFSRDIYAEHIWKEDTVTYPITGIFNVLVEKQISVFPNPFINEFVVSIEDFETNNYIISLVDVVGNKINNLKIDLLSNKKIKVSMQQNNLAKGIYYLSIQDSFSKATIALVKQ